MTVFRRITAPSRRRGKREDEQAGEPGYRLMARFGAADATLLRELALQIMELVGEPGEKGGATAPDAGSDAELLKDLEDALGSDDDARLPDDPAVARLLPDAYNDDPDAAAEFRRYTEKDLRAGKVAAARKVLATLPERGGRVVLSAEEGEVWLRSLNDMRLALGVRLNVTEDMSDELAQIDPRDPRYAAFAVYDWLTGMQDSLVRAMW